jgi:formylglycine-generating enzyme required for sulfatase activity
VNEFKKGPNDVILGRYVVDELWERTALIYLIHDREDPRRRFVAKCARPEHRRWQHVLDWFQREIRIWQSVSGHPHIVHLVESNRTDATDGTNYFFIEYVPGQTLHGLLHKTHGRRVSYPQALIWAAQIASAMDYAGDPAQNGHGSFVHRDLDSSNILLTLDARAKVSDWGLGKNLSEPDDQIAFMSLEDVVGPAAGKPLWMPPEQFPPRRAKDYEISGDIYYFGGLLVEMLLGTPVNAPRESTELQRYARTEEEVREVQARYHNQCVIPMLEAMGYPEEAIELIKSCITVCPGDRLRTFSEVRSRIARLERTVVGRDMEYPQGRCSSCGYIALDPYTHCPVCQDSNTLKRWDPASFRLPVEPSKTPAPAASEPVVSEPEVLTIPSSKQSNTLVLISEGQFTMGAHMPTVERLAARYGLSGGRLEQFAKPGEYGVRVGQFEISSCAVSNSEYEGFVTATGWSAPAHWQKHDGSRPKRFGDLPVVHINFADAEAFCQWKGVRLPTNDEWECAARGRDGHVYPWGNTWPDDGCQPCNSLEHHRSTGETVTTVSSFGHPSPNGALYNMAGNVWEWVDGGDEGLKHTRGGSWRYQGDVYCLSWFRMPTDAEIRQDDVGVRYALGPHDDENQAPSDFRSTVDVPGGVYRVGVKDAQLMAMASRFALTEKDVRKLGANEWRAVQISSFRMGKHLVTNEEYWRFTIETGYPWPSHWSTLLYEWSDRPFLRRYKHHPITRVTYRDAAAFCSWASGRLPSSDEWECAARGEHAQIYPWGDEFDASRCNVSETGLGRTSVVGSYPSGAAECGALDMAGNVMEWVVPSKQGEYVVRGGSYRYKGPLYGLSCLCVPADADAAVGHVGFRCVMR